MFFDHLGDNCTTDSTHITLNTALNVLVGIWNHRRDDTDSECFSSPRFLLGGVGEKSSRLKKGIICRFSKTLNFHSSMIGFALADSSASVKKQSQLKHLFGYWRKTPSYFWFSSVIAKLNPPCECIKITSKECRKLG